MSGKKIQQKNENAKPVKEEMEGSRREVLAEQKMEKAHREVKAEQRPHKREKVKKKISPVTKVMLGLLGIAVLCFAIYLIYYFAVIVGYKGYREYLKEYAYEEGTTYAPLPGGSIDGYDLVASNNILELYTRISDANIAVLDKRSGHITYSNPQDPDEDSVANEANKNILKSQFLLYYYNDDVVSGMWNSYTDCVRKGSYTAESITDGVRYIYTVGDDTAGFVIPIEYRLSDDHLEVSIPASQIRELGGGYLYRIQLLRYMGATSYEDEGYFVVPNGSGSLICFNNGKTTAPMYSQYIYDIDPLAASYTTIEPLQTARLPIYGICSQDADLLVSIEDSASNCVLSAEVSGAYNDYNFAFPTFVFRTVDDLKNFDNSDTSVLVMEKEMYRYNIRVRYSFPGDGYRGYAGIANYYRERLVQDGVLVRDETDGDIPLYCDVITGVRETGHFLGVQYLHSFAMTTFPEAEMISSELRSTGIDHQVLNVQGWFNGGYYHDAADRVHVPGYLGGRSGLEHLSDAVTENGGRLYADVAFQKVSCADRFFPHDQVSSRYYGSGYTALFGLVNPTTYRNTASLGYRENKYYALSPKFLPRYVGSFLDKTEGLDVYGFSLRDLGNYLISDKKRSEVIEREQALNIVTGQMQRLKDSGKQLMISEANAYAFAYATDIINAPIDHTAYAIVDERIPFYEMILHGYISYSTELLNYENRDDMDRIRLQMIESGAAPHYVFTGDESSRMKLTSLNSYYATTFENWSDSAVETYRYVNGALSQVQGAAIIGHEIEDGGVRRITYDNGVTILVNYGSSDMVCEGYTIPALGYMVIQK